VLNRRWIPAIVALALLAPEVARAGAAGMKHETSIYVDGAGKKLRAPEGVACDGAGNAIVADTGNGRLLQYTWREGRLGIGNEVKIAEITTPSRVQIDAKGNVLVLDRRSHRVVRVDVQGKFGGFVSPKGPGADGVVITSFRAEGDALYLLDATNGRVLALDEHDGVTRSVGLPAGGAFTDLAVEGGQVFAIDAIAATVWTLEKGATAFRALTGPMKDRMSFPGYVTADRGKLYVVDTNGHGLAVLGLDGTFVGRDLGIGWSDGALYYPGQLCITPSGAVFVADRNNNRVQVFSMAR
jgi:DNA-binding beta-propeller fold protein YncE